ncbi:hypothetical protein D1610_15235 [Sphingomonas gilva]|uniref:Uncharacterized protein n=1 Tax=Sphingomonas gilva TaxID=2305907 RepID=A0A396RLJ3_9SPHN|nr:hypothetical protein [Sphingomonas gilva]RHW16456.1 hypothetical protein D1610_15235 [Sphingomonas gilva]
MRTAASQDEDEISPPLAPPTKTALDTKMERRFSDLVGARCGKEAADRLSSPTKKDDTMVDSARKLDHTQRADANARRADRIPAIG